MIELDSNQNDILRQKVDLECDCEYLFSLQYASRSAYIWTSEMSVSWNGKRVKYIRSQDDNIHTL